MPMVTETGQERLLWHFPMQYGMTARDPIAAAETQPCWLVHNEFATYYSTTWRVPLAIGYKLTSLHVVSYNYIHLYNFQWAYIQSFIVTLYVGCKEGTKKGLLSS